MINRFLFWLKMTGFVFVLIFHFLWVLLASAFSHIKPRLGFRIRRSFCKSVLFLFNVHVDIHGNHKSLQGLVISNHRSMLDPLIELAYFNVFILSKAEVASYPMVGKGAKETGVLFVERTSDHSRKSALQAIERTLSSGWPVMIYPEGTTQNSTLTSDFRRGAFEVAFRLGIPVTPVMIEYPDPAYYWTDGSLMEYFKRNFSKPVKHKVKLEIGQPVSAENPDQLVLKTRQAIDEMIMKTKGIDRNVRI